MEGGGDTVSYFSLSLFSGRGELWPLPRLGWEAGGNQIVPRVREVSPLGTFKEVCCSERTGNKAVGAREKERRKAKSEGWRSTSLQRLEKLGCKGKNQIEEELFVEGHT